MSSQATSNDTAASDDAVSATVTVEVDGEVDEHGIPRSISHTSQNMFTPVWTYIHKLASPIADPAAPSRPFTHICIVCCDKYKNSDPTSTAWKSCLMRQKTSSNALKHMRTHKNHPFTMQINETRVNEVSNRIEVYNTRNTAVGETEQKSKKQRTLLDMMTIGADEVRILITRWLLSSGLPHTVLNNDELLILLRRLSNQSTLPVPARETFYSFADGEFSLFIQWVSRTLLAEFTAVLRRPFVSVLHDLWSNAANVNIVGASVMFIDSKGRLVKLSLMALPNPHGHAASIVADLVKSSFQSRYNINIDEYARFTVSDTTGSTRNVSDHFDGTDQVDCLMHLLSLCILYALGLKENTRSDGQIVVTPGGEFREGLRVIQKLRDLATFFSTPARQMRLKQIKEVSNLPAVNIEVDSKTRVGYALTLMRRSVYNHYAFTQYFEYAPPSEQHVWANISKDDWQLITEMEGLLNLFAQFSLGEVQKEGVASSYALLFRKLLSLGVDAEVVNCLVIERPDPRSNKFSQRREQKSVHTLSWGGKRCRDRLREQLNLRFPIEDINEIKALLLDPRIKDKAAAIVNDASLLAQAEQELRLEHQEIYQTLFTSNPIDMECKESGPEPVPDPNHEGAGTNSAFSNLVEVDAPSESSAMQEIHDDVLLNAGNSWNQWKSLRVKWSGTTTTAGKYNALQLYRDVNVLEWFKGQGQEDFPGIAVLARIYLGKSLSTAAQERFFSLSGFVVNELRTQLDDDRAEMLCLMKANWREYNQLLKEGQTMGTYLLTEAVCFSSSLARYIKYTYHFNDMILIPQRLNIKIT